MTTNPTARKRPSIADVATEAGVSKAAVSKVIRNAYGVSPAMRKRVETAIDQLEYRPRVAARAMRGASFTIGFEIPHLGNDFFNQITDGATAGLGASGYQLIIAPTVGDRGGSAVLESLVDRQVDGIIAIASEVDSAWLEQLAGEVPLVIIGRHEQARHFDTVTGDDIAGTEIAMDHLVGLGHTRIAHLTIHPESTQSPHNLRRETYLRRMALAGQPEQFAYADSEESAYQASLQLLRGHEAPTAIFAGYDTLAIGALRATTELHGDGDPVAVLGYDGIDLAGHPLISLSTIDQDGRQMGREAVRLLMQRIREGRTDSVQFQLAPTLRVRRSSRHA